MRLCVLSLKEREELMNFTDLDSIGWRRGGTDIEYKKSKLNAIVKELGLP
jgi:hypothetical protein